MNYEQAEFKLRDSLKNNVTYYRELCQKLKVEGKFLSPEYLSAAKQWDKAMDKLDAFLNGDDL